MSEAEVAALAVTHPNLHADVAHGTLLEPNADFVSVAEQYPVKESGDGS